jgi:hypothetical protein
LLHAQGKHTISDVFILTPELRGDSADAHAYALTKEWGIHQDRIITLDRLATVDFGTAPIVIFNDTHGSGNQFMRDWFPKIRQLKRNSIFLVAIVIAPPAFKTFKDELKGITVIPDQPALTAKQAPFTPQDLACLRKIGKLVYPKHPLGWGGCALTTAYYFQCPNNSLPVIWADGSNNDKGYPWNPLFRYKPKTAGIDEKTHSSPQKERGEAPLGFADATSMPPVPDEPATPISKIACSNAIEGSISDIALTDTLFDPMPPVRPFTSEHKSGLTPKRANAEIAPIKSDRFPLHRDLQFAPIPTDKGIYWLSCTPITVAQYKAVCGESNMPSCPSFNPKWAWDDHPMVLVDWSEAQLFCHKIGGRLPSLSEWRAATIGMSCLSAAVVSPTLSSGYATQRTGPSSGQLPNSLGFYDVFGNVWEWCSDKGDARNDRCVCGGIDIETVHWLNFKQRYGTVGFRCLIERSD